MEIKVGFQENDYSFKPNVEENNRSFSPQVEQWIKGAGGVTEYLDFNHFPEKGSSNIIYIDAETNTMYRYDTEKDKYVMLGLDPDEITIINANGGNY